MALFRGKDFLNGTPKNPQMEPHPRKAPKPLPELRIGLSIRPAAPSSPDLSNQPPTPRLLDRLRGEIRVRHYSIRTESAYVDWTRRFILFHHKRHPQDMGAADVEAFLTYLEVERKVAAPAHSGRAAPRRGRWGSRCTTTWSRRSGGDRRWRRSSVTMCAHVLATMRRAAGTCQRHCINCRQPVKDENMKMTSRWITSLAAASLSFAGFMHSAQATLVSTEQVAATQGVHSATAQRDQVNTLLARADVAAGLQERGVSVDQARQRVAALTDDEVATVAHTLDTAPAGASADVLGVIVTIFVVLLITDILGFTKVFPFTRSIR